MRDIYVFVELNSYFTPVSASPAEADCRQSDIPYSKHSSSNSSVVYLDQCISQAPFDMQYKWPILPSELLEERRLIDGYGRHGEGIRLGRCWIA